MKEDWLDKSLGDKLNNYDSPMDLENTWESFQAKREKPKKKRRFFFLWILLGLFTCGLSGSYFLLNYKNIHATTELKSIEQDVNSSSPTLRKTEKTNFYNNTITSIENENQNQTAKSINYENLNAPNLIAEKETSIILLSELENKNLTPSNSIFNSKKKNDSKTEFENVEVSFLPSLKIESLNLLNTQTKAISIIPSFENEKDSPSNFKIGCIPTPSFLTFSGGYGIRSNGKVLANEIPLDVISFNALFEKRFLNKRFYLKSGIIFDQFVNKTENTTEEISIQAEDNQIIEINHFQNGTTENVFGVGKVKMIEKSTAKNFNRYRLVSVPIILGLDIFSSKKINLQIEGGTARSIFGFHSGKYFDLVDADFEKRGVWQGLYGVNLNYKLGQNFNLFSSIRGNRHFNQIGKSEQLEMEKFSFHQIQLGIRVKL